MKRAALLVVLLIGQRAVAYHAAPSYARGAAEGGGGGLYFTGSPRFKGYDCAICHVEAEGKIAVRLVTDPVELSGGRFTPDAWYTVDVHMEGEHRGLEAQANENTWVAEFVYDDGGPAGRLAFDRATIVATEDERVVLARGLPNSTAWRFAWRAPAGFGPVTLYLGMVDGDGASDSLEGRTDPLGDDVALLMLRACAVGGLCADRSEPERPRSSVQCASAPGQGGRGHVGVVSVMLVLLALRERKGARGAGTADLSGRARRPG